MYDMSELMKGVGGCGGWVFGMCCRVCLNLGVLYMNEAAGA